MVSPYIYSYFICHVTCVASEEVEFPKKKNKNPTPSSQNHEKMHSFYLYFCRRGFPPKAEKTGSDKYIPVFCSVQSIINVPNTMWQATHNRRVLVVESYLEGELLLYNRGCPSGLISQYMSVRNRVRKASPNLLDIFVLASCLHLRNGKESNTKKSSFRYIFGTYILVIG